jgi:hypothetical protein
VLKSKFSSQFRRTPPTSMRDIFHQIATAFVTLVVLALADSSSVLLAQTATQDRPGAGKPISAELAKKCRALAIQAHPTQQPGSRYGSGQAQREYYRECIAKDGKMEN